MQDRNDSRGSWVSLANFVKRGILRTAARGLRPDEVAKAKRIAAAEEKKREIKAAYQEYETQLRGEDA